MVNDPPKAIDCLLMEGSMLGRGQQLYENEERVQAKIEKILRKKRNITFLFTSSQNVDRLVSAYKACLRTKSIFVIDIYTAFILDNLRKVSSHIPQFDWNNIRIKFFKYHADMLAKAGFDDLLLVYNRSKIDMPEINQKKSDILMMARDNSIFPNILRNIDNPKGSTVIYSMWEGYLTDEFKEYCQKNALEIELVHTSGHAIEDDLKAFAEALNPKVLVPIHTFEAENYSKLFKNVQRLDDGEEFALK